jgi:YegS/Rv2252/BmrU family lipid kinase
MLKSNDRILLIVNPVSGSGKAIDMVPEVEKYLTGIGVKCDIQISENAARATALASSAATLGYTRVISLGGDGTCNAVAAGIYNSDVIMGIIPGGRGNNLFRSLGIVGNLAEICKTAASGSPKSIDIGFVNDSFFINSFGAGFPAVVAAEISGNSSEGRLAYLKAIYRAWKKYIGYNITVRIDNLEITQSAAMIFANIGKITGDDWQVTPQAVNNDGKFDVCVIEHVKKTQLLMLLNKFKRANHIRLPKVRMYRCRQLEISGNKDLPTHYDGEIYDNTGDRLMVKCQPQALKIAIILDKNNAD